MSYNVLVVPEDPMNNGYILRPLVKRILYECGKEQAKVIVLDNPRAKGYTHAKELLEEEILERYAHFNLILFLPDADGKDRAQEFSRLIRIASEHGVSLLCCAAEQEVEVWLMAGHTDKLAVSWGEVRAEVDVKETIFEPFLQKYGDIHRVGGGRTELMSETLSNYRGLLNRCSELRALEAEICSVVQSRG